MTVAVGDTAPDFELYGREAGDGPRYRLSDALQEGGVVLQFFPLPFTGVCEAQMCAVRDGIDAYDGAGVTVWGITGHYPQLIAAWDDAVGLNVPILADYDHQVSAAYVGLYDGSQQEGSLPQNLRLTSKRSVVGIDRAGIVRSVWISEKSGVGPSDEVVAQAIAAASGA